MTELAPEGKSAEEIRGLWQWIETKLNIGEQYALPAVDEQPIVIEFPIASKSIPRCSCARARERRRWLPEAGLNSTMAARGAAPLPSEEETPMRWSFAMTWEVFPASVTLAHFWHFGHQNVERPFCVKRRTMPPQPAVWHFSPSRS